MEAEQGTNTPPLNSENQPDIVLSLEFPALPYVNQPDIALGLEFLDLLCSALE